MRAGAAPSLATLEERLEQVSGRYLAGLRAVAGVLGTAYRERLAAKDAAIAALRRRVAAAERERDDLRARLSTMAEPAPPPPAAPGDAEVARGGADTPHRPGGLWGRGKPSGGVGASVPRYRFSRRRENARARGATSRAAPAGRRRGTRRYAR